MPRVPERTCVGCRTKRPQGELLRVARGPGDRVAVDPDRQVSGRGAYVCRDSACVRLAVHRGALARALRTTLGPEDLATLRGEMEREIE
jgi:predicted RNA-binding protein YlxR (DUF448 family)